jgi:hypothetical protein
VTNVQSTSLDAALDSAIERVLLATESAVPWRTARGFILAVRLFRLERL